MPLFDSFPDQVPDPDEDDGADDRAEDLAIPLRPERTVCADQPQQPAGDGSEEQGNSASYYPMATECVSPTKFAFCVHKTPEFAPFPATE